MNIKKRLFPLFIGLLVFNVNPSYAKESDSLSLSLSSTYFDNTLTEDQGDVVLYTNLGLSAIALAYGHSIWGWGKGREFHVQHENWFSDDTEYGGADKLGHLFGAYALTRATKAMYKSWGVSDEEALRQGLWSSFLFYTGMEIGDGFSNTFGFSKEDMISNTLGQAAAYYFETHPDMDDKIDIRLEYNLGTDEDNHDPVSSYNNMRNLVAIKASGFDSLNKGMLKYLEFHIGYFSRGYQESNKFTEHERNTYVGIGINVAEIFHQLNFKKTGTFFEYYQLPNTYVDRY